MSNRELDKILRERLEQFELEPPMHLLDQILVARAGARRPIKPWLWWSGGAGIVILGIGIFSWFLFGQTSWVSQEEAISTNGVALAWANPVDVPEILYTTPAIELAAMEENSSKTSFSGQLESTSEITATETLITIAEEEMAAIPTAITGKEVVAKPTAIVEEEESGEEAVLIPAQTTQQIYTFDGLQTGLGSIDWNPRPKDGFPEKSCKPFSKEKWQLNWNLEWVASPEYVFRTISPKTPGHASYASAREEMEEIRGGFSTGLRISALTDFGVSLRTGLLYGQINEVFNYVDSDDIRIIVTNVFDGQGNIIGSDTIFESGTHKKVTYNRHRMLDIPLTAGYEFQFPRFSMAVHGGACFNLLFHQKGDIIGLEEEPVAISSGDPNRYPAFRDRLGLSLLGSIGFNYRLRPDIQFILEPQFRLILDPVTRSDYPLRQEYFLTGINLGVRYQL